MSEELNKKVDKILIELINTKEDVSDVKKEMKEVNKKMDQVLTAVDGLTKKTENAEAEQASNIVAHDRYEKRITKNEKDISNIHGHLNLKPAI
jgi:hypothetical protein